MYVPCFDSMVKIKDLRKDIFGVVVGKISDKELGNLERCSPMCKKCHQNLFRTTATLKL